MLVLKASCTRLWMGLLVQLVYISSVIFVETKSAKNGSTAHSTEMRSIIATILQSNQNYNTNESNRFNEGNSSIPCTQRLFNSKTRQAENDTAINTTFPGIQHRIKRCPPIDLAKFKSKRLETRSKNRQVEDWKNKKSIRLSESRASSNSAFENQRENKRPMIDTKKSFDNSKEFQMNASNFTSSNYSFGSENESYSSLTLNEECKNETLFTNQNNIKKIIEKIFEEKYSISNKNQEESTSAEQTGPTISRQTVSFENFDIIPIENETVESHTSNIPYPTSGFSNFLTDSSTLPMNRANSRETNPNENSLLSSTPATVTNPQNSFIFKKYKIGHFLNNFKENLSKSSHLGSVNLISEDQKSSHIPTIAPTGLPREFDHFTTAESPSIDSIMESASEDWSSSTDTENETKTRESLQDENLSTIILFQNNSDSYPQNLVNLNMMRKMHKIQPGEVVPPMNPNENWKIGENDTYYTIEELKSFFKMKKRIAAGKGMNKNPTEIVIDLNGSTIIDFFKHNLTRAHQNGTISLNSTKYKIFKLFSNSPNNFDRDGLKNESDNSTLIYSLIPQEDLCERTNSSENALATSNQELQTSKYLAKLEENLLNASREDENAFIFSPKLLSLNKTFSNPNLDFNKNDFSATTSNENVSNNTDILEDECIGNTEVILVNLKDPQPEKELLEKLCSGCKKIVLIADNNTTILKNAQYVTDNKNLSKNIISSMKKLNISDNLANRKSVNDFEGETNITDRKKGVDGKSVSSPEKRVNMASENLDYNFLPESRHHFKARPRDPDEQLIKTQFSFINPQVVDNFLDVYKYYSPRHSASRSRMRQQNHGNNVGSSEHVDWIPRSQRSYRNESPDNFINNLLRELVHLKNLIPTAYVSHGDGN